MNTNTNEAWIEINIPAKRAPDVDLLKHVVEPLVHTEFAGEIETWHFFWEPELRLRLRWRDPSRQEELESRLAAILDRWRDQERFESWSAGNHGKPGERHSGEATEYGPEMWDLIQKEWENGSEVALRLVALNEAGRLTGTLAGTAEAHWGRHVHLYTNRVFGFRSDMPWIAEIVLCLQHARGYLRAAIDALSKHPALEALADNYTQMEKQTDHALRLWEGQAERERSTD